MLGYWYNTIMKRVLPRKLSPQRTMILKAVYDFYGELPKNISPKIKEVALYIMGRKKGIELNEEQQAVVWYVKQNLQDRTYREALGGIGLPLKS